ncbi:hypothetical protein BJ878DRAFT_479947 [Calycina marina]|uniref:Myb-like domain-containing protein n=1 Tax=Calycina marina TaxID=1763456 RepID=A0A9P8CF12_9HELO|nr:hypothetical protein BJ878DRAFT_479947 [Calycina marina]
MPSSSNTPKVEVSFASWVLGGSLLSSIDGDGHRRTHTRKMALIEDGHTSSKVTTGEGKKTKTAKKPAKEPEKFCECLEDEAKKGKEWKNGKELKDKGLKKDKELKNKPKVEVTVTDVITEATSDKPIDDTTKAADEGWTDTQDTKIKEMKADNKVWREIAFEVGASKKDVMARFNEIKDLDQDKQAEDSRNQDGASEATTVVEAPLEDTVGLDFSDLFEDFGATDGEAKKDDKKDARKDAKKDDKKDEKKNDQAKFAKNNDYSKISTESCNHHQNDGGNGSSIPKIGNTGGESDSSDCEGGPVDGDDFCPELQPDDSWSPEHCDLLMYLEDRYNNEKWFQIQAGFFNWTGRMVDQSVIKAKFERDGLT